VPGEQSSGPRTVLSPIGVNVHTQPSKAAPVVGTAAPGTVLTVLGFTPGSPGWYHVKGQTHTGWISAEASLSAPGEYQDYASSAFSALYPATWTTTAKPPATVNFAGSASRFSVVTAATVSKLSKAPAGYGQIDSRTIVVCGVTSNLVTFQKAGAAAGSGPYASHVLLPVDKTHALGFYAQLSDDTDQLQLFESFLYSATFPSPQCEG